MTCRREFREGEAHPRHVGIHVGNGVFFTKGDDGSVTICAHTDGTGRGLVLQESTLTSAQWSELVRDLRDGVASKNTPAAVLAPTVAVPVEGGVHAADEVPVDPTAEGSDAHPEGAGSA